MFLSKCSSSKKKYNSLILKRDEILTIKNSQILPLNLKWSKIISLFPDHTIDKLIDDYISINKKNDLVLSTSDIESLISALLVNLIPDIYTLQSSVLENCK